MRSDLFAHINQFSYQEIDQVGTSTLINRMSNDINQVQNGVNMFLRLFLRSPFVVFGAMFMAFTVDHKAAVSFCIYDYSIGSGCWTDLMDHDANV